MSSLSDIDSFCEYLEDNMMGGVYSNGAAVTEGEGCEWGARRGIRVRAERE